MWKARAIPARAANPDKTARHCLAKARAHATQIRPHTHPKFEDAKLVLDSACVGPTLRHAKTDLVRTPKTLKVRKRLVNTCIQSRWKLRARRKLQNKRNRNLNLTKRRTQTVERLLEPFKKNSTACASSIGQSQQQPLKPVQGNQENRSNACQNSSLET